MYHPRDSKYANLTRLAWLTIALCTTAAQPLSAQKESDFGYADRGSANISISDYLFTAPEGWQVTNGGNHIFMQSPASGCQILIFEPQLSSGDLESDAISVFNMMYPAANWRYTHQGERQYVLSRGYLAKGLRYSMIEASMNATTADGKYHTEDGAALAIQAGHQLIIVSIRHSSLSGHWDCQNKYNVWPRFFNSFDVESAAHRPDSDAEPARRIVGVWKLASGGVASGEYVFAANGNFQFRGAIGTTTTTTDYYYEYLHITTYAFEGDGSYAFDGDKLMLKRRTDGVQDQRRYRFVDINPGGTGWKDRICLLSDDPSTGSLIEVCYEKEQR